jgi:hypothetical protein
MGKLVYVTVVVDHVDDFFMVRVSIPVTNRVIPESIRIRRLADRYLAIFSLHTKSKKSRVAIYNLGNASWRDWKLAYVNTTSSCHVGKKKLISLHSETL